MRSGGWLTDVAHDALDLVVPQSCAGCGRPGRPWCPTCAASTVRPSLRVPGPVLCRAAGPHEGPVARALVAYKDAAARGLARPLAGLLASTVLDVLAEVEPPPDSDVWIVPLPDRPAARRRRGGDHMAVLAARVERLLRRRGVWARRYPALAHVRAGRDQVGLTRAERRVNVAGSLSARRVPPGLVVVVDDVTTTGATLAEAARALASGGAQGVAAATVTWAATPRRASGGCRD